MEDEEEDELWRNELGNRWYYFVPPVMVGLWVLMAIARAVAYAIVPGGMAGGTEEEESGSGIRLLLDVVDWVGGIGWILLFLFYFALLSRKRASTWWSLGGFCCGLNLLLYVALLFLPARRYALVAPAPVEPRPFRGEQFSWPSAQLLKDSFVCEWCDSVLNYGVSECRECGARYSYEDGKPVIYEGGNEA